TAPLTAVVDRNADGAATTDVGPGSVNLLTGNPAPAGGPAGGHEAAGPESDPRRPRFAGKHPSGRPGQALVRGRRPGWRAFPTDEGEA
ncbi:hypothetical protein AB0G44_33705, partial [Streptomyces griseus]|uniref:hypothetical protein n=1 Tax=Streptomyces griseus TaxID=1911 RepID=UPI0033ED6047